MIITTVGHGNTGASAVLDFLRGYDDIDIVDDFEFQIIQMPDGILDLKYHLTNKCQRISINTAIQRFIRKTKTGLFAQKMRNKIGSSFSKIVDDYIKELDVISWLGRSNMDPTDVSVYSHFEKIEFLQRKMGGALRKVGVPCNIPKMKTRYFTLLSEEEFDTATCHFFQNIFSALGFDENNKVVLDMLFSATNPTMGMEFFENCKVIFVDRDPRDVYAVESDKSIYYWASYAPVDTSDHFIRYFRSLRQNTVLNENVLAIRYEDLIYNYFETTDKIMKFLGLTQRPQNEFKYFNPDVSVKYTQIYRNKCEPADIKKIESELSEWLFEFKGYKKVEEQKKDCMKGV